jgi:hypothetical protein
MRRFSVHPVPQPETAHDALFHVFAMGEEQWGGCATCEDAGGQPNLTRLYLPVRRDDEPVEHPVRLCSDCSSLIRHGAHEEWNGLVTLGDIIGRTVTWRRSADETTHTGVVVRDDPAHNSVVIAPPQTGLFKNFYQTVHRSNVTLVWPLVSRALPV